MPTVLVVDDEAPVRTLFRLVLERAGHVVREADGGAAALRVLAESPPDVVVTDVYMPDVGGLDVIQIARQAHPSVRLVAVTGGGRVGLGESIGLAILAGAHAGLSKPVSPSELVRVVAEQSAAPAGVVAAVPAHAGG